MTTKKAKPETKLHLLIYKLKSFGNNLLPSWVKSRKRVLISITIDIFAFMLISLIFHSNLNAFLPSILLIWIVFSYISNRYNIEKLQNIKRFKYKIKCLKNTCFALTFTLFYILAFTYFIQDYIVINNQFYLNNQFYSYILILIIFSFISLLIQYSFNRVLCLYDKKDSKFLYYGSENTLNKIKLYSEENNLSIKYIKVESLKKY